ncbi:hypothetical protein, partial [Paenibacillus larvae]
RIFRILCPNIILTEGYEYGSFHFLEPSFLHNYTDSTFIEAEEIISPNFQPKELTDQEDIISFLFANTLKNASDFMDDENSNINDKCFILGNAKVMTHEGKSHFLSKMILFVDSIVGLSIGD